MPTWDEKKRLSNIKDHGLDFEGCEAIFDNLTHIYEDLRDRYEEQRFCVVGWLNGMVVHLLSITHIFRGHQESDFDIGEPRHPSPDDSVARRRVAGAI